MPRGGGNCGDGRGDLGLGRADRWGRMTMRKRIMRVMLVAAMSASPALAAGSKVSSSLALARQAEKLKPGDWVWAPRIARSGPVLVYVDLGRQLATVYRNGVRIGVTTVSSGKPGHATPTGVFTILQKDPDHHSSKYDDAPMPFQQRLTWEGVAMHAGNLPGYPASHGCVRLPMEFSRLLFGATPMGGTVIIAGQTGDPVKVPAAGVLAPAAAGGAAAARLAIEGGQDFSWNPALSPRGPVSVIVSTGDQMVVVLRNGVEIGRTRAVVQQRTTDAQVMTLTQTSAGKPEWIQVGVSGLNGPGEIISTVGVERMHIPIAFLTALRSVMTAGTTVLVTEASVSPDSTGGETTVLASEEKPPAAPAKN